MAADDGEALVRGVDVEAASEMLIGPGRDGTAQSARFPRPLSDHHFHVDEMGLDDLVAISARHAGNLRHEDERTGRAGTWAELFTTDPIFALAELSTLSLPRHAALLRSLSESRDPARLAGLVRYFAHKLDASYRALERGDEPEIEALRRRFEEVIRERADDLRHAETFLGETPPAWHALWSEGGPSPAAAAAEGDLERLDASCQRFLHACAHLKQAGRGLFERSLHAERRQPALGLALSFFELFARAQASLNEIARKRLEFYFLDVLRFAPLGRVPDRALIALSASPGVRELVVPAGTEFSAGRDEKKNELIFVSRNDLTVTDARVESLATVQFDCDELVSPERELGFVTRIRAHRVTRDQLALPVDGTTALFRSVRGEGASVVGDEAKLGFAIASPLLDLREGRRVIRFSIELAIPESLDALAATLTDAADGPGAVQTPEQFFRTFGQLFTRAVMSPSGELAGTAERREKLRHIARRVLADEEYADSLRTIEGLLDRDRTGVFHDLFRHAFSIRWTGEKGWHDAVAHHVAPLDEGVGLEIVMGLGPEAPAIVGYDPAVHGGGYDTALPVVGFRVSSDAIFHPYSLLRSLDIEKVTIRVGVTGVTNLFAYNQIGTVDPTKVFQPFGPLPTQDSSLVIGSYEAARKPLKRASLEIEWGALPRERGGWRAYYRGYDKEITDETLKADVSVLRDNEWQPADPKRRQETPLFKTRAADDRIMNKRTIDLAVIEYFQPISPALTEEEFRTHQRPRDGLFRISLAPSETAFGHQEYPALLTRALTANAEPKRKEKLPVPNAPYTPLINSVRLNYVAESTVRMMGRGGESGRTNEKIFHEHPFGGQDLAEASSDRRFSLMPAGPAVAVGDRVVEREGYLFIGLSGRRPLGTISLLVHMVGGTALRSSGGAPDNVWFYLAGNRWHALDPHRVLYDSTRGLLTSGIIAIDVPPEIARNNTVLPGDLLWLAIGTDHLESIVSRLHSITTGGLEVVWEDRGNVRPMEATSLPAGSIRSSFKSITGLETVKQLGPTFGGRPAEDYGRLLTRASERLRHKGRACTPWDYERLTLEEFPALQKVKCFANLDVATWPKPSPGSVLIVVVPRLAEPTGDDAAMALVSGPELDRIAEYLRAIAPAAARIVVRNPTYEQVQIRGRVKLTSRADVGPSLQRVNQALIDYIAPWSAEGKGGRFGWSIRRKDVAGYIHELPFVEFVTGLSLLHISEDKDRPGVADRFTLGDTAFAAGEDRAGAADDSLSGRYPWSLAVPSRRHFIQAVSKVDHVAAEGTGIGDLEIGRNFIVKSAR